MRPLSAPGGGTRKEGRDGLGISGGLAWSAPGPGARSLLGSRIENPEEPGAEPRREKFLTLPRCGHDHAVSIEHAGIKSGPAS